MRSIRSFIVLSILFASACNEPVPSSGSDASVLGDAPSSGSDAAVLGDAPSSGSDAAVLGDAPMAESCESIAASISCGDVDRECSHRALGAYCASERTEVLRDDLRCIRMYNDTYCRSFADPSGARACIEAVHEAAGYASAMPLAIAFAAACGDAAGAASRAHTTVPPLAALSDSSLAALMPCVEAASSCEAAHACMAARYPEPHACFE